MLLTGATGFVGSHVARVLVAAGCDVHALVRPGGSRARIADLVDNLTFVPGDLASVSDPAVIESIGPDLCMHLAWYAEPGRYLHAVPENLAALRASLDLVEALAAAGCRRLLVAGSCAEYGPTTREVVFGEEAPVQPTTAYARAKAALLFAAQDTAAAAGMDLVWARLFFLYGPWEQPTRVVPAAMRACLRGEVFPATAGGQVRDYLHIFDAACGLCAAARSEVVGPVNISSGERVTLRSVLEAVEDSAGTPGLIHFGEKPYLPGEWMWMRGANTKLLGTGWQPRFRLADGIAETLQWWRSNDRVMA